jgi:hypothetical protein
MDQFAALGSVAFKLHTEMRNIYYLLLPIFFMASLVIVWLQNPAGSPEFIDKVKRAFVATLLLSGFAEITDIMLFITSGIAEKIDDMSGLDAFLQMAGEKAQSYPHSSFSLVLAFDDLIMAVLSYCSFAILYCARYIMVAIYHFSWVFLSIMAPILLLFHLFSSQVTVNLFRSMFEIASWKVVWSVLSVMIKALPFGTWYAMDGNYLTLIVMNFVIAICMVSTPLVVHSLFSGSFTSMAGGLSGVTAAVMVAAPGKAIAAKKMLGGELGNLMSFGKVMHSKMGTHGGRFTKGGSPPPPAPPSRQIANSQTTLYLPPTPPIQPPPKV